MKLLSGYGALRIRYYLRRYGSYSEIREASKGDINTGIHILPPLPEEDEDQIREYVFRNWYTIDMFKYERKKLKPLYKAWVKENIPKKKWYHFFS